MIKPLSQASLIGAFFISLSSPVLGSTLIAPNQPFSSEFIIFSENAGGGITSHGPSTIQFEQTSQSLTSNISGLGFPDIFVTSESNQLDRFNWRLSLVYETGTNQGFVPPGIRLGGQAINEWIIDLGSLFSDENIGIKLNQPVEYNSATISWFDDGIQVVELNALSPILTSSSSTNLMAQFILSTIDPNSDLGALGNGIDQANILVEVTVTPVPESSINWQVWLFIIGCITISGLSKGVKLP